MRSRKETLSPPKIASDPSDVNGYEIDKTGPLPNMIPNPMFSFREVKKPKSVDGPAILAVLRFS